MKYNLDIIQIPGTKLSEESLPIKNLQVLRADLDQTKVFDFKQIIKVFTEQGDSIISEICSNLEKNLEINSTRAERGPLRHLSLVRARSFSFQSKYFLKK